MSDDGAGRQLFGRVVFGHGRRFVVETDSLERITCLTAGRVVQPVCGDKVRLERNATGGSITEVMARKSLFSKTGPHGEPLPSAANLDQVLVTLAVQPEPDQYLTDKYLAALASMGLRAGIIFNKIDLAGEATVDVEARLGYLESLGYPVYRVSARSHRGLEPFSAALIGKGTLLVGQSGVGKSSLLNALVPDAEGRVAALSEATGEGRHTTTSTTLHPLAGGGVLFDSPGVRDLSLATRSPETLRELFVEFPAHATDCRFADCQHLQEPGCAVRAAVERGEIAESRYKSYQRLVKFMRSADARKYD